MGEAVEIGKKINPDKDKRRTKVIKKWSIYRDEKSIPHETKSGIGIIGRLIKKGNDK